MAKVKAQFFLPMVDVDGRDLDREIIALEMELYIRFVGWTFQGHVRGSYQMADGTQAVDESAWYMIVLDENRVAELEELLREFKRKTKQEAIFLEIERDVDIRFV